MKTPVEPTKQDELNAVLQTLDKEVARLEAMDVHTILECWNLVDWRNARMHSKTSLPSLPQNKQEETNMKWVLLIAVTLISGCSGIRFCHEPNPDHSCPSEEGEHHGPCPFEGCNRKPS